MSEQKKTTTDFGYQTVPVAEKSAHVRRVFDSVAPNYDIMNDLMSFGLHRAWKRFAVRVAAVRQGQCVLDVAAGTGDLTALLSKAVGAEGHVYMSDINANMLAVGRDRLLDAGIFDNVTALQADAQALPFADDRFDRILIGFGLRNVTCKETALSSLWRVLKPGGRLVVLEFSKPLISALTKVYDAYSFSILPKLGQYIADDGAGYQYLAESIRRHPDQQTLLNMMVAAGFESVRYHNLAGGIVAVHVGFKY